MKRLLSFIVIAIFTFSCSVKSKIIRDVNIYRTYVARTANYNTSLDTLFNTLKIVLEAENEIEYASESMRIIITHPSETINLDNIKSTKTWIESRINGAKKPYKVEIKVFIKEIGYTDVAGMSFEEKRDIGKENQLQIKLYEQLNGKIELNRPLKTRIADYNNEVKKEKQKINY